MNPFVLTVRRTATVPTKETAKSDILLCTPDLLGLGRATPLARIGRLSTEVRLYGSATARHLWEGLVIQAPAYTQPD